jgi:hypothetical protein
MSRRPTALDMLAAVSYPCREFFALFHSLHAYRCPPRRWANWEAGLNPARSRRCEQAQRSRVPLESKARGRWSATGVRRRLRARRPACKRFGTLPRGDGAALPHDPSCRRLFGSRGFCFFAADLNRFVVAARSGRSAHRDVALRTRGTPRRNRRVRRGGSADSRARDSAARGARRCRRRPRQP